MKDLLSSGTTRMSMTLREAYETFLDRGAPIFKGERRRPAGGMNASCWRKMCKDIRLWKDLAKANIIFEEVTRGQRGMDFEMFTTALAIVADRKRVPVNDMCGFVLHYAAMYAYGNGGGDDNSSVNSMGSGGSLSSMGSVGSMSSITSRIRKGKKPRRRKRVGGMMKAPGAQHGSEEGKSSYGYPLPQHQVAAFGVLGLGHNSNGGAHGNGHGHKGIATTSILEETKGSSRGSSHSSPRVPSAQDKPTPAPLPAPSAAVPSSLLVEASAQPKHHGTRGKPSLKSFAKNSDAKGEYDRRMRNSLEALNSSLLRREETSQEDLDASGFTWEQKERFNVKVEGDPSTWGWAHDGWVSLSSAFPLILTSHPLLLFSSVSPAHPPLPLSLSPSLPQLLLGLGIFPSLVCLA